MNYHEPVLLKETLEILNVQSGQKYIDATLGQAGHSLGILKKGGLVLGIDVNESSLRSAYQRAESENLGRNLKCVKENFKNIEKAAIENNFSKVSGIIFDLGYSSFELDQESLGLSFLKDEPLDMRLDRSLAVTAADLVNKLPKEQLEKIIRNYSDEKCARKIAECIVKFREVKRIQTTKELADLIKSGAPSNYENGRIHPATRTFQALRIAVNDELENLRLALPRAARLLLPRGVIVVISFHSLEDRIVKDFGLSVQPRIKSLYKKPLLPGDAEVASNIRSRSAKLRAFIKENE